MKRFSWLVLGLFACGHKAEKAPEASEDCTIVAKDPTGAMKTIAEKYKGDPVKAAETIEKCIAPTGTDCERIAAVVAAIPGMMGTGKDVSKDSVLTTCKGMPPEMQHCMLPSYTLGHADECAKISKQIADTAAVANTDPAPTKPAQCGVVSALVTKEGVWVSAVDGKACFGKRAGSDVDQKWIEAALKPFVVDCRPAFEVSASDDVAYKDLIATMDLAVKVGLVNVNISAPADLVHAAPSDVSGAPAECEKVTAAGTPKQSPAVPEHAPTGVASSTKLSDMPAGGSGLPRAPVIIVSKDEIKYADKSVGTVADLAKDSGEIAGLKSALPANPTDHTIVIQADQETPANVIVRVIASAKAAGYDQVLFAVKNK